MLADADMAVAANGIGGTWRTPIAIVCMVVAPTVLAALPEIIRWWRRKRTDKTMAGAGAAPTLPPPCSTCQAHTVPTLDGDQ